MKKKTSAKYNMDASLSVRP